MSRPRRTIADAKDKELLFLRDKVHQLQTQVSILQKRIRKREKNPRYTLRKGLFILCHMETFQIPRRRVTEYFDIARSTLYRWLHQIDDEKKPPAEPTSKTPMGIAAPVWEITKANVDWGRVRIANQLALLNIFIAASTVRGEWYNEWRPHMTLDGARPDDVYVGTVFQQPGRDAKEVPRCIERRVFRAPRVTGYRLKEAA